MKLALGILALLAVLGVVLGMSLMQRAEAPPDCTDRVVIMRGPDGQPLECVCIAGALSTCFSPGP